MKTLLKYMVAMMILGGMCMPEAMAWWGAGYPPGGYRHHAGWHQGYYDRCPVKKVCYHRAGHRMVCNYQKVCHVHPQHFYR